MPMPLAFGQNGLFFSIPFFRLRCSVFPPIFSNPARIVGEMDLRVAATAERSSSTLSLPHEGQECSGERGDVVVSLEEWQRWGTASPVPAMVVEIIRDLKELENNTDDFMSFGGIGGKLQGNFKIEEDKKHRAVYGSLTDSEKKLQFFSARQIACRLLGSRGYLCQKCWLAMEDCMCSKLVPCSLWNGVRFWLYMHPKDFLRQNNTGKLLWEVFGVQSASMCLYGIHEHEEIMWREFGRAGKSRVWFLYPNKNAATKTVQDIFQRSLLNPKHELVQEAEHLNFVLIDGTWSNSSAMFSRLKEHGKSLWGEDEIPCISLTSLGASAMHKLRPQPSWDRTCTAAAAIGLLSELDLCSEFSKHCLDEQAVALESALRVLLDALTTRRRRMGRSVTRRERSTLF